ncbi:AAA family ATPase [Christensenellaceae bacterium OttesenSCG-928-K19]|nr:AAA family ATPase [Christensenellaceae bacterium OttesenSCG-928-K19]
MKYDLAIGGHAWNRKMFYSLAGRYHEFGMAGGGALLAQVLQAAGAKVAPVQMDDSFRRQFVELKQAQHPKTKETIFLVDQYVGWEDGATILPGQGAQATVIYDAGHGGVNVPEKGPVLWACRRTLPEEGAFAKVKDRAFLMMDVAALRENGGMVSQQISWERTATELVWQLFNNPSFEYLLGTNHIVITISEDALVYFCKNGRDYVARLVLSHGGGERMLRDALPGSMPDVWPAIVAAAAMQFADVMEGACEFLAAPLLCTASCLLEHGYDPLALADGDYTGWLQTDCEEDTYTSTEVPMSLGKHTADPDFWCISDNFKDIENKEIKLYNLAFATVKQGLDALHGLPHLTFGFLTTVDRREIEAFQNIRNLILEYAAGGSSRPLSIAVFGAPGSGKSFGVTQIAKNILPGKVEKLEFNVSQLQSAEDLAAAFHKVRDSVLTGKLPLVFFDEFDSDKDGMPLGWLKSFLMPMQDGTFKDGSGEHPVGKCIMVFAGGTSPSFEEFTRPLSSGDAELIQSFKNVKGPDFVSRLRGTINIMGPNPVYESDKNYLLRRAILLRSLCQRKLNVKDPNFIDDNLLHAMLVIDKYKHGARSMEAILDMSRIEGNSFTPVSLPFYSQLALHVDADAFIRLVLRDVTLNSYTEQLAAQIHKSYVDKKKKAGDTVDADNMKPWEELSEDYRDSNRRQARSIKKKLNAIGCGFDAGDALFPTVEAFTAEEVDVLSRLEHDLWMTDRISAGWKYGKDNNLEKKTNPSIVPWEKLPKKIKQYDIDTVLNIMPLLHSIGLRVYRTI